MSQLRAHLDQRIFIGILEEFLNELSPHSFFPHFFFLKFIQFKGALRNNITNICCGMVNKGIIFLILSLFFRGDEIIFLMLLQDYESFSRS
jgi:hypothetical protein